LAVTSLVGHGNEKIERGLARDEIEEFPRIVLGIGKNEAMAWGGLEDVGGKRQQIDRGIGGRARGTAGSETNGLAGLGVEAEEGLGDFLSEVLIVRLEADHLPLAIADQPMRINGQELTSEMAAGATDFAQGALEGSGFLDGVGVEHVVDGEIGSDGGQAVSDLKTPVSQTAATANARAAQGGFMKNLKCQVRFEGIRR
jgi:hypothetical protein